MTLNDNGSWEAPALARRPTKVAFSEYDAKSYVGDCDAGAWYLCLALHGIYDGEKMQAAHGRSFLKNDVSFLLVTGAASGGSRWLSDGKREGDDSELLLDAAAVNAAVKKDVEGCSSLVGVDSSGWGWLPGAGSNGLKLLHDADVKKEVEAHYGKQ